MPGWHAMTLREPNFGSGISAPARESPRVLPQRMAKAVSTCVAILEAVSQLRMQAVQTPGSHVTMDLAISAGFASLARTTSTMHPPWRWTEQEEPMWVVERETLWDPRTSSGASALTLQATNSGRG